MLTNAVVVNWKTTVAGLVVAGIYAWANASGDWRHQLVAVGIAVLGAVTKDHNS